MHLKFRLNGTLGFIIHQKPDKHNWQKPHQPNLTGTKKAYYPNRTNNEISKKYKTWKN